MVGVLLSEESEDEEERCGSEEGTRDEGGDERDADEGIVVAFPEFEDTCGGVVLECLTEGPLFCAEDDFPEGFFAEFFVEVACHRERLGVCVAEVEIIAGRAKCVVEIVVFDDSISEEHFSNAECALPAVLVGESHGEALVEPGGEVGGVCVPV